MTLSSFRAQADVLIRDLNAALAKAEEYSTAQQESILGEIGALTSRVREGAGVEAGQKAISLDSQSGHSFTMRQVLMGAKVGFFTGDETTIHWSPELCGILGMEPTEGSTVEEYLTRIHPEDHDRVWAGAQEAMRRGGLFNQEYRYVKSSGEIIWIQSTGFVEHDVAGRPVSITGINQDITAWHEAEEALRQSQARLLASEAEARQTLRELETIYQNAPIGLCEFDTQLRWKRLNQRIAEINGCAVEEHLGKTPREIVPDVGEQAEAALRWILATGQPLLDFEMSGTTPALPGVVRFWNERWVPVKDSEGSITGISVTAEEITEHKRALEAAKAQADYIAWLARLPEENPSPVARLSLDGIIQYRNRAAARAFGPEFSVGETVPNVMLALLTRAAAQGRPLDGELPMGSRRYFIVINPVPNETYANLYSFDITRLKQVEDQLARSEEQMARAFRSSPVAMTLTRASDGRFIDANRAHEALTGYRRDQLIGRTVVEMGLQPGPEERQRLVDLMSARGSLRSYELQSKTHTGETCTTLVSLEPIDLDGEACILSTMIDITERKQVEEALRAANEALRDSEEKFHSAFDHAVIGFAMTSPDGIFLDANQAYCALTGYSIEELRKYAFYRLVHPDDIAENIALNDQMSSGKTGAYVIENRYVRKDGRAVWVRKSISLVRSPDGAPRYLIALVEDISTRKGAEEALKTVNEALNERNRQLEQAQADLTSERNRLLAVMEALPVGLAIIDEQGGVTQANPGFEGVWGSPRPPVSSLEDYDPYQAWWVDSGRRVQPEEWASARAVREGVTVAGQYLKLLRFDGTFGYVLNSGAPIFDRQGRVIGAGVAIMDMTAQIEAEQALQASERSLRESEDRLRVALSTSPLLVYTCDRDLRYTWVNNLPHGVKPEEVIGRRDEEMSRYEDVEALIAVKRQAVETGQGGVHEVKVRYNGVEEVYILTTDPIRGENGEVTGLTCAGVNITEQKLLEMEREETERRIEMQRRLMEQREHERQGIARDIHDGPIQTLSGTAFNLQFLKETYPEPALQVELNQITLNVKNAVRELREVVNDLRPPAIIRFGLSRAIQMHTEDLRDRFPDVNIVLDAADDVKSMPDQACLTLFRVYQEAMNNIVRHAEATRVEVLYHADEASYRLEIRDNGRGFAVPGDFNQLTSQGHFGLAGMKERVETVHGTFTIESAPGEGTRIRVEGPVLLRDRTYPY